jgi:succinate dehydrogenase / fumarate reductase iron-sulfur subunit
MSKDTMKLTLNVWRQSGPKDDGHFERYEANNVSPHMSFLEMLDVVNEELIEAGKDPIAFEHDCREGICGSCGVVVDGAAHGPWRRSTVCQLHMREYRDGDEITIEPWRAKAFPVIKDLVVDRASFDRIIEAGGYVSVRTGSAPDANEMPVAKIDADAAFDAAACIGCGACVAACPNASASLFVAAKVGHLSVLPQGQPERLDRVRRMVAQHEAEGFGSCTNHYECEAACPKGISVSWIARMNRDLLKAMSTAKTDVAERKPGPRHVPAGSSSS